MPAIRCSDLPAALSARSASPTTSRESCSPAELARFEQFAQLAQHELLMLDVIQSQRELSATRRALAASQKALALRDSSRPRNMSGACCRCG